MTKLIGSQRASFGGGNGVERKWNLVKWATVTSPKKYGGLAIREARLSNIALLGKLIWSILHDKHKLWVKVLSHKYIKQGSIWNTEAGKNISLVWKSILKALEALKNGFRFRIGDGSSSLWYHDWTGMGALCHLVDFVNISDTVLCIKDASSCGSWDGNKMMTIVPNNVQTLVDQHTLPSFFNSVVPDKWIWGVSKQGIYSCLSAYDWLLEQHRNWDTNDNWDWIWKLKIPQKIQHFIWSCMHKAIPTNWLRHHCNMANAATCQQCSEREEDVMHCLRDCPDSRYVWANLQLLEYHGFLSY